MSALLEMRGVAKRYAAGFGSCVAAATVLRSVDLTLRAGESVAVVGAPGAGKSTLLLIAAGLLVPDRGDMQWCGDPSRAAAVRTAIYHFAASRQPVPTVPPHVRLHLIDDPDPLGDDGVQRLARWSARRCAAGAAVLVATRSRATALVVASRVVSLAGGELHADVIVAAPRVAEASPRRAGQRSVVDADATAVLRAPIE
jgi:ABC-type cobalamin transport system ATPase subunit